MRLVASVCGALAVGGRDWLGVGLGRVFSWRPARAGWCSERGRASPRRKQGFGCRGAPIVVLSRPGAGGSVPNRGVRVASCTSVVHEVTRIAHSRPNRRFGSLLARIWREKRPGSPGSPDFGPEPPAPPARRHTATAAQRRQPLVALGAPPTHAPERQRAPARNAPTARAQDQRQPRAPRHANPAPHTAAPSRAPSPPYGNRPTRGRLSSPAAMSSTSPAPAKPAVISCCSCLVASRDPSSE
jgi:hypothetical protein